MSLAAPVANSRCSQCGAGFRCGMEGGDAQYWCAALPPLPQLPAPSGEFEASCLCPDCLRARLGLTVANRTGTPP
jgi:hypothetical protein